MLDFRKIPSINGCRYIFTHHVREKMRERFNSTISPTDIRSSNLELLELMRGATENKAICNNTTFMAHVYETYGTEQRIKFMQNGQHVFITVAHEKWENCYVVVTCYGANTSSKPHFWKKKKWGKQNV